MSLFAKHNQLTTSLSGHFSIINQNSNINIKNSTVSSLIPSFVINNGQTLFINTDMDNALEKNVILDSSKNYIDDQQYNKFNYSYIEKSIYPYNKLSVKEIDDSLLDPSSENEQLIIPSTVIFKDGKQDYIQENNRQNLGDGNEFYSAHFLTNTVYGYWGNKYGGQWIKDLTDYEIDDFQNLQIFFNTSPRNLNGHIVNIIYSGIEFSNLNIKNFYNGVINITFSYLSNQRNKFFIIQNNNLILNLIFNGETSLCNFTLNDNKDLNIKYNGQVHNSSYQGNNNYLTITFGDLVNGVFDLFRKDSYGNKVNITPLIMNEDLKDYFIRRLENNNSYYGNFITVNGIQEKINNLINDSDELVVSDGSYMDFTIDETYPKTYRDVSDIGTIIGWPAFLPVPRGYYVCDGRQVKIDLNNPLDEYYNGQLAYYLNGTINTSTIKLPNIPSAVPSCMITDPNYYHHPTYGDNFVPIGQDGLIYIIKYNNNFENIKTKAVPSTPRVIPPPYIEPEPPSESEPTIITTTLTTNFYVSEIHPLTYESTKGACSSITKQISTLTQEYVFSGANNEDTGNSTFNGAVIKAEKGWYHHEITKIRSDWNSGAIFSEWTFNRVNKDTQNGYYQFNGEDLKVCVAGFGAQGLDWIREGWGTQAWLYVDFSNAKIDMVNGFILSANIYDSAYGEENWSGTQALWESEPQNAYFLKKSWNIENYSKRWKKGTEKNSCKFNPNKTTEQILFCRKYYKEADSNGAMVFITMIINEKTISIKVKADGTYQHEWWSRARLWHSPKLTGNKAKITFNNNTI